MCQKGLITYFLVNGITIMKKYVNVKHINLADKLCEKVNNLTKGLLKRWLAKEKGLE
jgi:hypothetical protein